MANKNQKIENMFVTLPMEDGTNVECKILTTFDVINTSYVALMPMDEKGNVNQNGQIMLYRLGEDAEHNPTVHYIEDDNEYETAAAMFQLLLSKQK